jgi:3-oxoadipate enol-lactonase
MKLKYHDSGECREVTPIIFLHAFPLNQRMWAPQVAEWRATHRVITLDWPGFGESAAEGFGAVGDKAAGIDDYAALVIALLDHLKVEKAHLCGLSMGGYVALALYRIAPERVASLILCDTRASADSPETRNGRYETISLIAENGREGLETLFANMLPRLLGETTLNSNPSLVAQVREMMAASSPEGIRQALTALAERRDASDLLPALGETGEGPLIIVGREDRITPASEMSLLAEAIKGSHFAIIERAGHLPNLEQPDQFNAVLRKWLNRPLEAN